MPTRASVRFVEHTMGRTQREVGFTLVELLVVVGIIALLTSILAPSLGAAKELAQSATCGSCLRSLSVAMATYFADNDGYFWPIRISDWPGRPAGAPANLYCYFWGTNQVPVDTRPSPFLRAAGYNLASLWCPALKWGTYVPQGGVTEPTTTYGYNAWCLDPPAWTRKDAEGKAMPRKKVSQIQAPADLFVFADSGLAWAPAGVVIFQNSTHLEPVTGTWVQTPTTHFRHRGHANALCVDGHVGFYDTEGWSLDDSYDLGFVGTANTPHYDQ